jgi:hypothetical protein
LSFARIALSSSITVKKNFRLAAVILVLVAAGYWAAAGANRGWTKTSVPRKTLDDVTGIEGVRYEKRFVPGLDFLALTLAGAGFLAGVSLFLRPKTHEPETNPIQTNQP